MTPQERVEWASNAENDTKHPNAQIMSIKARAMQALGLERFIRQITPKSNQ